MCGRSYFKFGDWDTLPPRGALAPFPFPGLKSLQKKGVPKPSAEADGNRRTYSRELSG